MAVNPGTHCGNRHAKRMASENENYDAPRVTNQKRGRKQAKLIPLDDLIPKQDVKGGRQLFFGANRTTQTIQNPTKES